MVMRILATACLAAVLTQDPSQPPPPFRTGVDLVEVDVAVLDRDRRSIRGLTAADFTILENGQPQEIVAFHEVHLRPPDPAAAAWMRDVAPDVRSNEPSAGRLLVLVLDDATIPGDPATVKTAKDVARAIVGGLGPQDTAAVLFTLNNRNSQDFTSDRSRLLSAVDRLSFGFIRKPGGGMPGTRPMGPPAGISEDRLWYQYSIATVRRAVESLMEAPQRRKTLVYISVGVPADFAPGATEGSSSGDAGVQRDLAADMQRAFAQAVRSNVTIYAIDPAGLQVDSARENRQFLQSISENTGGFAVVDTNAPEAAVPSILAESGSYYLLGFQSTSQQPDRRFRRLTVRVNRPDVTVRARSGYYGAKPAREPDGRRAERPASPLDSALGGLLPKGDLPMQVAVTPFAVPGSRESAVAVVTRLDRPPAVAGGQQVVDVLTAAFDTNGNRKASVMQTATLTLRPDRERSQYEVLSRLDLKPGRYLLRVAAHARDTGASGSVYHDVEIPDFSKGSVALSGIVLSATPTVPGGPRDLFASLLPVVPTTQREFAPHDVVTAFVRVYQGGRRTPAPASLVIRILDAAGRDVFRRTDTLAPESFGATRDGDYRIELPLVRLSPGPHVLTIEATVGSDVARGAVRFAVYPSRHSRQ